MNSRLQAEPLGLLPTRRCEGCTHCIRVCPTEAIRIRRGKAQVLGHRCIQCGLCIRTCPKDAWKAAPGFPGKMNREEKATAILDPSVFWQCDNFSPERVAGAFFTIGFSEVQDMGESFGIYRSAVEKYLASEKPALSISSACPAVVQLVEVKYPSLLEYLVPILSPLEIAVALRRDLRQKPGEKAYYVAPCVAQAEVAKRSAGEEKGIGAIPFRDLCNDLKAALYREEAAPHTPAPSSSAMKWAAPGGGSEVLGMRASLVVDGIQHVDDLLDRVENGLIREIPFMEAWACSGGCLGGPLNIQDPFWARYLMTAWIQKNEERVEGGPHAAPSGGLGRSFSPRPGMRLDEDLARAMKKLRRIDEVVKEFPGTDCGLCGCPTCLALAEDIVQGHARKSDCLYLLKKEAGDLRRSHRMAKNVLKQVIKR